MLGQDDLNPNAQSSDPRSYNMKSIGKRMIIVSGYKVWPAEVENTLYGHPAVHEACVIATRDARQGEAVKALVVLKPDASLTAAELIAWCRDAMAVYKAPRFVEFVAQLPKSNTGKILWRELQQRELGPVNAMGGHAPVADRP